MLVFLAALLQARDGQISPSGSTVSQFEAAAVSIPELRGWEVEDVAYSSDDFHAIYFLLRKKGDFEVEAEKLAKSLGTATRGKQATRSVRVERSGFELFALMSSGKPVRESVADYAVVRENTGIVKVLILIQRSKGER